MAHMKGASRTMSKHTPAAWTPDEIRQMQEDWWRTDHNLT